MQIPESLARHLERGRAERALLVERQAIDEKARTATLAFASETPYERFWGVEILDCLPTSMRQGRLRNGANLLCEHDKRDVVGVVESIEIGMDRIARAVVRFGKSARAEEVWQDVRDGIRRSVSVGYLIHKAQLVETKDGVETYRVTDWEPFEISLVSVPADATVGIGRSAPDRRADACTTPSPIKEQIMQTDSQAQTGTEHRNHAAEISAIAAILPAGGAELALSAIQRGLTVDQFQREIIENFSTKPIPTADLASASARTTEIKPIFLRSAEDFRNYYQAKGGNSRDKLTLGEFMRAVAKMPTSEAAQRALSVGTSSAGGYAVPSIVMPRILEAMVAQSSLMQAGAAIVPLEGAGKEFSFAAVDTIPTASWRLEEGTVAESGPTFRNVLLKPQSLSFVVKVSRELLQDGVNVEPALNGAIAQAFAVEMDRAGLRGTGTAPEIRGLKNISGVHSVPNGANGAVLAGYANIFSAAQLILEANARMPNAAIMSPRSLVKLGALLDTTNQPLQVPKMLENVRMLQTSQIPNNLTVGSSSDCSEIYVGDFTQFVFGLREEVSIKMLEEAFWANGQIGFLCHARVDVASLYPKAFALVTGVR